MIVKQYIKDFENYGLGMFVHFGIYSVLGHGEWAKFIEEIPWNEYQKYFDVFNPDPNWAKELVKTAKSAGCKYITLTARHHDGFSLYDTCGLNEFDAIHAPCKRDLIKEFVDECNKNEIIPFFYHTLLDWHEKSYEENFKEYLVYLRKSVEILCTNYGKIGGIWFDGMCNKPNEDWEEDALYGMIRKYQPEAMIINNMGLDKLGALGHIELDSVTFERGKPQPINLSNSPKYIASEMCEILNDCWGIGVDDLNYKSPAKIIEEMVECRKTRANFLLNVGPEPSGMIRTVDKGVFELIGRWMKYFEKPFRYGKPTENAVVMDSERDFALEDDNGDIYLFVFGLPTVASQNVTRLVSKDYDIKVKIKRKLSSATCIDTGDELSFEQNGDMAVIHGIPFSFGRNLVVRIIKLR